MLNCNEPFLVAFIPIKNTVFYQHLSRIPGTNATASLTISSKDSDIAARTEWKAPRAATRPGTVIHSAQTSLSRETEAHHPHFSWAHASMLSPHPYSSRNDEWIRRRNFYEPQCHSDRGPIFVLLQTCASCKLDLGWLWWWSRYQWQTPAHLTPSIFWWYHNWKTHHVTTSTLSHGACSNGRQNHINLPSTSRVGVFVINTNHARFLLSPSSPSAHTIVSARVSLPFWIPSSFCAHTIFILRVSFAFCWYNLHCVNRTNPSYHLFPICLNLCHFQVPSHDEDTCVHPIIFLLTVSTMIPAVSVVT